MKFTEQIVKKDFFFKNCNHFEIPRSHANTFFLHFYSTFNTVQADVLTII